MGSGKGAGAEERVAQGVWTTFRKLGSGERKAKGKGRLWVVF